MAVADKLTTVLENVPKVFESGKKAEYIAFWKEVTRNGTRTHWRFAFAGFGWSDNNFKPPETIYPEDARYMFQMSTMTSIDETQVDFTNTYNLPDVFSGCSSLVSIRLKIGNKNTTFNSGTFMSCSALKDLVIIGTIQTNNFNVQWSENLTHDSLMSIINALSTTKSGLTVTLSKTAANKAFETSEGAEDGSTSQEWLDLIATRNNWTISLV